MRTEKKNQRTRNSGAGSRVSKKQAELNQLCFDIGIEVRNLEGLIDQLPSFIHYLSNTYVLVDYYHEGLASRYKQLAIKDPEFLEEEFLINSEILKELIETINYLQEVFIQLLNITHNHALKVLKKEYSSLNDIDIEIGRLFKTYLDSIEMMEVVKTLETYNEFIIMDEPGLLPNGYQLNYHYSKIMSLFSIVNHLLYSKK